MANDELTLPCPRKSLISYFWITTFSVFAAQFAVDSIRKIVDIYGIRQSFFHMAIPAIFLITLLRFSIGNVLHIRRLETKGTSPKLWLYDFSVIFLESLILLLLGMYTWGNDLRFLKLFIILLFVDIFWVLTMIPHFLKKKRPEPLPWAWALLNLLGVVYLSLTVWANIPLPYTDPNGPVIFFVLFVLLAFADIYLADYYSLLKPLSS